MLRYQRYTPKKTWWQVTKTLSERIESFQESIWYVFTWLEVESIFFWKKTKKPILSNMARLDSHKWHGQENSSIHHFPKNFKKV